MVKRWRTKWHLDADTATDGGSCNCDVVARTVWARSLSVVFVLWITSSSAGSWTLALLCNKTGSCVTTSLVEVGSCITALVPSRCVSLLKPWIFTKAGSCVTTLGLITHAICNGLGKKVMDVEVDELWVTSTILPLPLSLGAGSCVATCWLSLGVTFL